MNPKLLLGLALVLCGALVGCSTIKQPLGDDKPPVVLGQADIHVITWTTKVGYNKSVDFVTETITDGTNSSTTSRTSPHIPGKNEFFSMSEKDVFTRGRQTNLVRSWESDGDRRWSHQIFYHDGKEVAEYRGDPCGADFISKGGSPYSIIYKNGSNRIPGCPNGEPDSIIISDKSYLMVDWFICTNGLFYPVESRLIKKQNDAAKKALDYD
jgi:hypothetical protein